MRTSYEAYKKAEAEIVAVGESMNGWIWMAREPSGHFEVEIDEEDFKSASEEEVCIEIQSAISSINEDYRRKWREVRENHFGSDLGML